MGWAIAAIAAYFLLVSGRGTALTSTARAPQPTAQVSGGQTTISIPGVGTYQNIGGGQSVSITLDGNLLGSLFGGGG